jgi:copper(I)-binding protein
VSRPESRSARTRPTRVAAVVGALIGAVALAGCGAGQVTQTSEQVAAVNGANATVGAIAVRNAQFEYDTAASDRADVYLAGTSAPLEMSIVNTGAQPDRLVAARSPVASAVEIVGNAEVPGGRTLVVEGAPAEAVAAPTAEATGAAVPTPTAALTTPPAPATSAAGEEAGARTASVVLTGLRENLQVGPTYPVILTFERAGDVHVSVPVGNPDEPREDAH